MKSFKENFLTNSNHRKIYSPSVSVTHDHHKLTLRFDAKDVLLEAGYEGPGDPWLASLCTLVTGRELHDLESLSLSDWKKTFMEDQTFWDYYQEEEPLFFHRPLELFRAALDIYKGRDYLYSEESPLICRCFGVRERDVISHLQREEVSTPETLAGSTKAGMGCRSCVPQLKRWLVLHESQKNSRFYKEKAVADWLLEIDYMLSCFPKYAEWKMALTGMKEDQVFINYHKQVSQREEESTALELQKFLAASVDEDLSFFLRKEN